MTIKELEEAIKSIPACTPDTCIRVSKKGKKVKTLYWITHVEYNDSLKEAELVIE
jgi:hypothetical protein